MAMAEEERGDMKSDIVVGKWTFRWVGERRYKAIVIAERDG